METLGFLRDLAADGYPYWLETIALGLLLGVYLAVPRVRRTLCRFFAGRNELESTGNVIRAISGLVLLLLVLLWLAFGR